MGMSPTPNLRCLASLTSLVSLVALAGCAGVNNAEPIPDESQAGVDPTNLAVTQPPNGAVVVRGPLPPIRFRCSATAPFTHVAAVSGVPLDGNVSSATLSQDERELFYTRSVTTGYEIVHMTRATAAVPFSDAAWGQVTDPNNFHRGIALSRDGLSFYAAVRVPINVHFANTALRVAHRATATSDWGPLSDTGFNAAYPYSISQVAFTNANDFLASVGIGATWRVKKLSLLSPGLDPNIDTQAALDPSSMASGGVATADGSHAYFGVGLPNYPTTGILFGTGVAARDAAGTYPVPLAMGAPINTAGHGSEPQWLSNDECRLYYIEQSSSGRNLMVASK
jgi:hypothetical protein